MDLLLFANLNDRPRIQCFISRAAFRIEKLEELLQRFRVRGVPQKCALTLNIHQPFVLELVEMVGKSRIRNIQSRPEYRQPQDLPDARKVKVA